VLQTWTSHFLCVLRAFAVRVLFRINRKEAKSAKKSAIQTEQSE